MFLILLLGAELIRKSRAEYLRDMKSGKRKASVAFDKVISVEKPIFEKKHKSR